MPQENRRTSIYENEAYTGVTFNDQTYSGRFFRRDKKMGFMALNRDEIELVIRKRPAAEVEAGGRWVRTTQQPEREMRLHLIQYKDDIKMMKQSNEGRQPFCNDSPL